MRALRATGKHEKLPTDDSLNDGLVGFWDFNEGAGYTAHDISGRHHDLTLMQIYDGSLVGSPPWVSGKYGTALSFDGTNNQYINMNYWVAEVGAQDYTISTWFKTVASPSQSAHCLFAIRENPDPTVDLLAMWDYFGSDNKLYFQVMNNGSVVHSVRSSIAVTKNEWHHVSVGRNQSSMFMYLDGVDVTQNSYVAGDAPPWDPSTTFKVAGSDGYHGWGWHGTLDEFRLYKRALLPAECLALYNGTDVGGNRYICLRMDEGNGNVAYNDHWCDGIKGKALDCNTTEGTMAVTPNCSDLKFAETFSFSMWLRLDKSNPAYACHPLQNWTGIADANYVLYLFGETSGIDRILTVYANRNGEWGSISAGANPLTLHQWYHVAFVYKGAEYGKLYIDSQYIGAYGGSGNLGNSQASNVIVGESLPGVIDQVRLYNRALTEAEVYRLFANKS